MTEEPQVRLAELLGAIHPTDRDAEKRARRRLDTLTKPPGSLGRLEDVAARVAAIQDSVHPDVDYRAVILAAGDHGVVEEGVSPYPQDVTWQMVANFVAGGAAINQLAAAVEAELWLIDVGVAHELVCYDEVRCASVMQGTRNMTKGPAMTGDEALEALLVGVDAAHEAAADGVCMIGIGEMGIGNSTAAAALASAYTGASPAETVGRGTGLDDAGVAHKTAVVETALAVNETDSLDALGILAAVGGLEIACLCGVVLGAARERLVVVADGYITSSALLAAARLQPAAIDYVIASHRSPEPGHVLVLEALGLDPVLDLDMRLGEGTGAALAMGVIDGACRTLAGMATFGEAGVETRDE